HDQGSAPARRDQPAVVGHALRGDQRPAAGAREPNEELPEVVLRGGRAAHHGDGPGTLRGDQRGVEGHGHQRRGGAGDRGPLRPAGGEQNHTGYGQADPNTLDRPGQSADHGWPMAWLAYWLSSTENEDLVLLVPGPGSAATSWRILP